jgi:hypothetical protein
MLEDGLRVSDYVRCSHILSLFSKVVEMAPTQDYKNHTRFDPKFHFFLAPLLMVCLVAAVYHVIRQPSPVNMLLVPVIFAVLFLALIARMYALKVQDRVIRMEEMWRMERLGVSPAGLGMRQIVALRFASDMELPGLVARARTEGLTNKQIKEAIGSWRPDFDRV